jgi:hypothetical protein|tara:strand:- start:435 stop:554 length:120 start_codon:yes stop_codon:yes gene_type:complete
MKSKITKKNKNKNNSKKFKKVSLFELQNSPKALLFRARA